MRKNSLAPCPKISNDCKNEQLELSLLLKMFRGVHPVLVIPDVHGRELAEKLRGGGAMPSYQHWLYTDAGAFDPGMLDALDRLCLTLGYRFRFMFSVVLEERGAEMVKNATGVDAKVGGRLAVVICAPLGGRKLWHQKEAE